MSLQPDLTRPQWAAARMLVVRLNCEATGTPFHFSDIGWEWLSVPDGICAVTEDGTEISQSDLLMAAIANLWSTVVAMADQLDIDLTEVISELGLDLAASEPEELEPGVQVDEDAK